MRNLPESSSLPCLCKAVLLGRDFDILLELPAEVFYIVISAEF